MRWKVWSTLMSLVGKVEVSDFVHLWFIISWTYFFLPLRPLYIPLFPSVFSTPALRNLFNGNYLCVRLNWHHLIYILAPRQVCKKFTAKKS
jgi:hypothetical protein